jgi:hypothetical protein
MPSTTYLVLRSAHKACPRRELGARLEARTTSMQALARCFQQFFHTLFRGVTSTTLILRSPFYVRR